jgi:hypothetical protein
MPELTFRRGVPLPDSETDKRGTVTPREEIKAVNEQAMRNDDLGDSSSKVMPPIDGHEWDESLRASKRGPFV